MFTWTEKAERVVPGNLVQSWDGSFLKVRKVVVEVKASLYGESTIDPKAATVRVFYSRGGSDSYSIGENLTIGENFTTLSGG